MTRALVTGSSGLLGSELVRQLRDLDIEVDGVDRNDSPYTRWPMDCHEFFTCSPDLHAYDWVFHCAALVGGRERLEEDPLAYAANLEADAAFIRWAARVKPSYALYVSSANVYPSVLTRPLRETDVRWDAPLGMPDGTYGWIKLTGEHLASLGSIAVARPFGIYGPGQKTHHPVASFCEQARQPGSGPLKIWGTGTQVRDFIHVRDAAGIMLFMAARAILGPVNIGTGRGVSLATAASMAISASGYPARTVEFLPEKPEGLPCRVADITVLAGVLGRPPVVSLEDGIKELMRP